MIETASKEANVFCSLSLPSKNTWDSDNLGASLCWLYIATAGAKSNLKRHLPPLGSQEE